MATPTLVHRPRTLVPPGGIAPLAGYTVAVASDRRRHPLAALLEAAGARTVGVQALRAFSAIEPTAVRAATEAALAAPIDELLVASDFGFRSWLKAARRWGLADRLVERFAAARLLASNPRAADAIRDLADGVALVELCHALRAAGADVVEVATYQYEAPAHADLLRRLGDQVVNGQVDAVAFLGPPAVTHLIAQAAADHRHDEVLNALAGEVAALCLGELAAAPLAAGGVAALTPDHPYLEALVALACAQVPQRAVRLAAGGRWPATPAGCCPAPRSAGPRRTGRRSTTTPSRWRCRGCAARCRTPS